MLSHCTEINCSLIPLTLWGILKQSNIITCSSHVIRSDMLSSVF